MADLGTIATGRAKHWLALTGQPGGLNSIVCPLRSQLFSFLGRSETVGSPDPPSLYMDRAGVFPIPWQVAPGDRQLTIKLKSNNPASGVLPYVRVRANKDVGVQNDVIVNAIATSDWQTLDTGQITVTEYGLLLVELVVPPTSEVNTAYWDTPVNC